MKAVILIKARPGYEVISSEALQELAKKAEDVEVNSVLYCFGRFDGVITCSADKLNSFAKFAEFIRKEGNFLTETLIAVE